MLDHLTRTFRRSAELTGTMPLGPEAEDSPSGDGRWDGVALTLFADTDQSERGPRSGRHPLMDSPHMRGPRHRTPGAGPIA